MSATSAPWRRDSRWIAAARRLAAAVWLTATGIYGCLRAWTDEHAEERANKP
jgi:hypothetical protein